MANTGLPSLHPYASAAGGAHAQSSSTSGASTSLSPSDPPSPSSPSFSHQQSISINGRGIDLAVRPGTALGSSHFASPPNSARSLSHSAAPPPPSAQPTATRTANGGGPKIDYASLPRWEDAQVASWLASALPALANNYAETFARNDIRGSVLLEVDQSALKEMGVRSVGDRVKICVAVRALRSKYNSAVAAATPSGGASSLSRRPSALGRLGPSPLLNRTPYTPAVVSPSATFPTTAGPGTAPQPSISSLRPGRTSLSYSARNISVGNRIPPPLHLAQSNVVSGSPATGAVGGVTTQLSPPSATTSPKSATFAVLPPSFGEQGLATSPMRAVHPPTASSASQPTTATRIPPTPSTGVSTTIPSPSRPSHSETSPMLAQAPQQYSSTGLTTSHSASSLSSRPPQTYGGGHRKANSSSIPAPGTAGAGSASTAYGARPAFPGGQAVSYAGHPYAASASSGASSTVAPSTPAFSTASTSSTLVSSSGLLPSALPALPARFASAPAVPAAAGSSPAGLGTAPLSNLDVMRKAVKFTSADGVTSRVLAVADAKDGREVLARVMKKFGGREGEDLDGWGVWTTEVTGAARLLTEQELFQICQNAAAPERTRGLIVRRHHALQNQSTSPPAAHTPTFSSTPTSPSQGLASSFSPSAFIKERGRKLQWVFGDSHAVAHAQADEAARARGAGRDQHLVADYPRIGAIEPASPTMSAEDEDDGAVLVIAPNGQDKTDRARTTKLNRASTVSILSGLEAPDWARDYYASGERALDAAASSAAPPTGPPAGQANAASSVDTPLYQRGTTYVPPQRTSSRRTAGPPASRAAPAHAAPSAAPPELPPRGSNAGPPETAERQGLLPDSTRKLRNFFGQRPPSELITTHLTEFFPLGLRGHGGVDKVDRKLLSKQVRASIRRSMSAATGGALVPPGAGPAGRRSSTASVASRSSRTSSMRPRVSAAGALEPIPRRGSPAATGETSWEHQMEGKPSGDNVSMSRFSGSSNGSASEGPVNSASSLKGGRSPRSSSGSVLDPPDESAEDAGESAKASGKADHRIHDSPESSAMLALPSNSSGASTTTSTGGGELAETRSLASSLAPSYLDPNGLSSSRLSRRMSRMSGSSRLSVGAQSLWERRSRDSDVASVITVDDVTAELETRRASGVSWRASDEDEDEDGDVDEGDGAASIRVPGEEEGLDSEFDDDLSDEDDFDEDEDELDGDEPDTAKPEAKGMKWIKGALIGAGSFGSVFLGMNPLTGSLMAVKQVELPTGSSHNEERKKGMLDALEREIELLKVLQHDNIVQYLDSSTDDKHLNIFLEYVPGGSVAALLQNYGAFEEALVSKFVRQILTGLQYLHEREIIHRDIKGANILVDNKGNIKISDFGISKKVEDNLLTGAKVHRPSLQGSVYWMAPEVVKQTTYTSKADIWSLGCLVVEMLTGAHPWANLTQMQAIFRIGSSSRPTVPDDISADASDFLDQTFEIDHEERPPANELLHHPFIRETGAGWSTTQQTPTRATFSAAMTTASRLVKA